MSYLQEIGNPLIGQSLAFNFQASGDNNRIITRRYQMRIAEQSEHIKKLIKPTLKDPVYTKAYLVNQSVAQAPGDVDCILTRVFAEIPTEWDDYDDMVIDFPGVMRPPTGGEEMLWRNSSIALQSVVRVNRKYFLSNPQQIPVPKKFTATDAVGQRVTTLTPATTPSNEDYAAMVAAGTELCMRSRISRWMGDIWVRETLYARAQ
jgi:hypothetical protein